MVPMKGQGTFLYNFTDGETKILYGNFITAYISRCCLCMHGTSNTIGITKLEGKNMCFYIGDIIPVHRQLEEEIIRSHGYRD